MIESLFLYALLSCLIVGILLGAFILHPWLGFLKSRREIAYPYNVFDPAMKNDTALVTLKYADMLSIANLLWMIHLEIDKPQSKKLKGVIFDKDMKERHQRVHDCFINCCLSLEELHKSHKEGDKK